MHHVTTTIGGYNIHTVILRETQIFLSAYTPDYCYFSLWGCGICSLADWEDFSKLRNELRLRVITLPVTYIDFSGTRSHRDHCTRVAHSSR